jgi:hypothetical protein
MEFEKRDNGFLLPIDAELEKNSQSNRQALNYVVSGDFHALRQYYVKSKDADAINREILICCTWVDPDDPLYDVVIGTGSILIAAVLLGRYLCVRELLPLAPNRELVFTHATTLKYAMRRRRGGAVSFVLYFTIDFDLFILSFVVQFVVWF